MARSISTASSVCTRGSARSSPLWNRRQLAIVHACGSPDSTRSHFDAQDYMETATPGVKSTGDGWLNRYLPGHARRRADDATVPRGLRSRSSCRACCRAGAGARDEPDRAVRRARRQASDQFERAYSSAGDSVLNGDAARSVRRDARCYARPTRSRYAPENGADYPRSPFGQALKQIAQLMQGRMSASRWRSPTSAAGTRTSTRAASAASSRPARRLRPRASRRSSPTSAIGWTTPSCSRCRSSGARCTKTATAAPITGTATR